MEKALSETFAKFRGSRVGILEHSLIDSNIDIVQVVGAAYELCCFAELRDRLRAGDICVAGSRQYRAVED